MSKPLLDPNCYNCNHPVPEDVKYCAKCGQKHHDGKYSVGEVITEFISANFNLDAKIFQTIIGLFKPGYLTTQYFKGVHKTYYKPVRLFLVLGIIVFALISPEVSPESDLLKNMKERVTAKAFEAKWDSIRTDLRTRSSDSNLIAAMDTMYLSEQLKGYYSSPKSDSTEGEAELVPDEAFTIGIAGNDVKFDMLEDSIQIFDTKISNIDFLDHQPKEFVEKFFPERTWAQKLGMTQSIRVLRDGGSLISFITTRIPIFLLLLTPMYAFVFWLMYFRQKRFFVEHFVFVLHLNSAALIFVLIAYLLTLISSTEEIAGIFVLPYFLYYYFALKRYYQQGYGKTFLKFLLLNIASSFVGTIAIILILLIGLILF